ncbi:MAG: aldehyde dehydrogenase family protein [Solirubrobacterales bacterium]
MTLLAELPPPQLSQPARDLLGERTAHLDGAWEEGQGEGAIAVLDPATGSALARLAPSSTEQAERAVGAARRAFDSGPWAGSSPRERSERLHALADLMEDHSEELSELTVAEVGCPIELTRFLQVQWPIDDVRWSAEAALRGPIGGYEQGLPPHPGPPYSSSLLRREPVGVVAAITAFNSPLTQAAWKLGPGLAAGCTFVLKPASKTPLATIALLRLIERAGFPPGVVNLVHGDAPQARVLTTHRDVDMVMFTGSAAVGAEVMASAARALKPCVLELGGKSATIVLPGSDLEQVTGPSVMRFLRISGQACGATTRTLLPRSEYERYLERAREFLATVRVGDPWDPATEVGPLIREGQRSFVEEHVAAAVAAGAVVEAGGGRPNRLDGYFVNPTIVGGVANSDPICREELFGPVGAVLPYDSVEEAVAIANDSDYGLHGAVYGPPDQCMEVARRIRAGTVSVNGGGSHRPDGPWGGFKRSGFGREMGEDGFREFFAVKHVQWPLR